MTKRIRAFDAEAIHAGNKGLAIDHDAVARTVDELLDRMTLAQKIHEIRGCQAESIDGLYYAGGDESLGIPPYRMVDGPRGARAGTATAFPVAAARAATFDVELERRVGMAIGLEVAAKGGNVLLAPTINLLRHPGWGRAQETYSEDPFHMGAMAVAFVSGAQNHVLTSPKHFAANNLENTRFELSANIEARALHELYLPHFKRVVTEAAAASVMSAYNRLNGVYCGEHPELLTRILRDDWGFTGFVESDWFLGTRSTSTALIAGLDIEMPAPYRFTDELLHEALESGELDEEIIHRNARHALYQKIAWRLDQPETPDAGVVECAAHVALAREVAEKSIVLLKNEAEILPLDDRNGVRIAVVGDLADTANLGDRGSSFVTSSEVTTPLAGISACVKRAEVEFFSSDSDFATLGEFDVSVVVAGLTYRDEGEFIPTAQEEAEGGDLARGGDRATLCLPDSQRQLIERVAALSTKTVVVLEGGSAIVVQDWLSRVEGLLMAWYPGREGGHAIADVLFGVANPSGKLPVCFPTADNQLMDWDITALDVPHDLLHGYRYLDHHGRTAEFAFGFGLSYTRFELGDVSISRSGAGFRVLVPVSNVGSRAGASVVQLYVSCTGSAVTRVDKELKGFGRVELEVGETVELEMELADNDLCYFDVEPGQWRLDACAYTIKLGFSADHLGTSTTWVFDGTDWCPSPPG
ncbi:MAG: glycosyl hydrolase [Gammaproteobacteria bacterium]|nr:MAG: glycosyl hydrolase [Gammaproteobacteria bacterium]